MEDTLTPAEIAAALLRRLAEELEERPHETVRSLRQAELARHQRERERLEEELGRVNARLRFLSLEEARFEYGEGFSPDGRSSSPDGPSLSTRDGEPASLTSELG